MTWFLFIICVSPSPKNGWRNSDPIFTSVFFWVTKDHQVSSIQKPGYLGYLGDEILPTCTPENQYMSLEKDHLTKGNESSSNHQFSGDILVFRGGLYGDYNQPS